MRIRSVKPEFWSAEDIGALSRDARLLYIATWNMADDEGLLEWSARRMKAFAFPYDDDLSTDSVEELMTELVEAGFVYAYEPTITKRALRGKSKQSPLGWIVMFQHHQKPNRPQRSSLEPPPIDDPNVVLAYAYRHKWTCHACKGLIDDSDSAGLNGPALDDVDGVTGPGFPTAIRVAHQRCASGRLRARKDMTVQESLDVDVTSHLASATGTGAVLTVVPSPPKPPTTPQQSADRGTGGTPGSGALRQAGGGGNQGADDPQEPPHRFSDTRFSECSSLERRGEGGEGEGLYLTSPGIFRHPRTDHTPTTTPDDAPPTPRSHSSAAHAATREAPTPSPATAEAATDFPSPDFPTPDFPSPDFSTPDFSTPEGDGKSDTGRRETHQGGEDTSESTHGRGRPKIEVNPDTARFIDEVCQRISISAEEATGRPTPPTDRWRTDVERLLRIDERTEGQIKAVVTWATNHGYWRTQITTGRHLRSQFAEVFGNAQFAQWTIEQNIPDRDRPPTAQGRRVSRALEDAP